jgi:antirestriction protein
MSSIEIFVVSLASYNAGKTVGQWVDLDLIDDADELQAAIATATEGAEEWAIHDVMGLPSVGEHPSLEQILKVAALVKDHGEAAVEAAMEGYSGLAYIGEVEEALEMGFTAIDKTEDRALADYAQEQHEQGVLSAEFLLQYIDWERVGRDLRHDVTVVEKNGTTFFFEKT